MVAEGDGCPIQVANGQAGQIVSEFAVAPAGMGFDLNADGTVDNKLSVLSVVNDRLKAALMEGRLIQLAQIGGLENTQTDSMVTVNVFEGMDKDGARCDNLGGQGTFDVVPSSIVDGKPRFTATGSIANGTLIVVANDALVVSDNDLTVRVMLPRIAAQLNVDGTAIDRGLVGGVVSACDLSKIDPQLNTGQTTLDLLVQLGTLPDVDLDGDGLEMFALGEDHKTLGSCTDADGTVIQGHDCACDPRIADGYSLAFTFKTVPATLVFPP
jgi:hypothetical protein